MEEAADDEAAGEPKEVAHSAVEMSEVEVEEEGEEQGEGVGEAKAQVAAAASRTALPSIGRVGSAVPRRPAPPANKPFKKPRVAVV